MISRQSQNVHLRQPFSTTDCTYKQKLWIINFNPTEETHSHIFFTSQLLSDLTPFRIFALFAINEIRLLFGIGHARITSGVSSCGRPPRFKRRNAAAWTTQLTFLVFFFCFWAAPASSIVVIDNLPLSSFMSSGGIIFTRCSFHGLRPVIGLHLPYIKGRFILVNY